MFFLHQNDLERQGINTKKGRAAAVMIDVTVPIVVTVSDDCDSDCCNYFDCYSLLAMVPVVSPVTPFAVSTVVTVGHGIMCIADIGMNELTHNCWRTQYTRRLRLNSSSSAKC
jgi:hypothetical protein